MATLRASTDTVETSAGTPAPSPAERTNPDLLADLGAAVAELRDHLLRAQAAVQARIRDELAALRGVGSVAEVLAAAPRALCVAAGFDRALVSGVRGSTWLPIALHVERGVDDPVNIALDEFLRSRVIPLTSAMPEAELLRRRAPALVLEARDQPRLYRPLMEVSATREYVVAAVQAAGTVLGYLHADRYPSERLLTTADRDLVQTFADGLGLIIERATALERLALQQDQVTAAFSAFNTTSAGLTTSPLRLERATEQAGGVGAAARPATLGTTAALPRPLDSLTPRERDVLRLLASGATNAEIANRLTVSETTVKSHVKHILRKLHATNRAEAIARYLGLVRGQARSL
ncbi:LuxR family transcriptional regulator [Frankia sp. CNm7]|uniref:LuxR family transcriptional regulator n=2 Tax=Frankia nepalensis TaxID=1836974 RepID=A0A937UTR6_9ACTN|nr:LuxR family transcriptional regulator [Frankia nepalensis]MBL7512798.1 LuxR family transcriptional regulator [Frankia nepalensis]MBL7521783.1 LuxR family transcriptional regulator [Frankia nepalensis]MBL7631530.1 LuxR family transcriptional regulator [Frankia nepalensis]